MRILIVEDEVNIANNLRMGFLDENYVVDVVHDGNEAYDLASVEEFDVIILDLMLPGMDGVTLCKSLRQEKVYTPIIMLTAKDAVEDKVKGLEAGADDYLVKPFSFEELLARVKSLIRRTNIKEQILKVDTLELNPSSHIVKRSGREINLTGKEYILLEYFMNHPNQILTRDQIINHVWDYSYDSFSNIVDVFIKRLREKIETPFPKERKLFTTVRGLGYRFGV
jgi:DNA-binding response OmpR family regulator